MSGYATCWCTHHRSITTSSARERHPGRRGSRQCRSASTMSVSIYDIAKKAGVSPSTVSRALEDHSRIGAATKKRIQELAREMDYVPSTVAKSLAASKTWTIGMVLATISDPFMGRLV